MSVSEVNDRVTRWKVELQKRLHDHLKKFPEGFQRLLPPTTEKYRVVLIESITTPGEWLLYVNGTKYNVFAGPNAHQRAQDVMRLLLENNQ